MKEIEDGGGPSRPLEWEGKLILARFEYRQSPGNTNEEETNLKRMEQKQKHTHQVRTGGKISKMELNYSGGAFPGRE